MTIYSGFSHKQWWFSIAMLIYQRVVVLGLKTPCFGWRISASLEDQETPEKLGVYKTLAEIGSKIS